MENEKLICIIMATKLEAKPFIAGLELSQKKDDALFPIFKGQKIILAISGIGKANAAMAATYCCLKFNPVIICNLGSSGANDKTLLLGDIFQISKIYEPDRPDLSAFKPYVHYPAILENFKSVNLATQDRPVFLSKDRKKISSYAQLADMEAAAICQVCKHFGVQFIAFKFVSDTPGHNKTDDIIFNIKKYGLNFFDFFKQNILPTLQAVSR